MESQIAKGKTEFFEKLKQQLAANGGGVVNDRGCLETIVASGMLIDIGKCTADAVRQPDGSWEVSGAGSAELIATMAIDVECKARKVAFLPRHVEKKVIRAAQSALNSSGHVTLRDGTVIQRK